MFETVEILATTNDDAERMNHLAASVGQRVHATTVWTGPVPNDSYIDMGFFRMARPEFMAYRKANQLDDEAAVTLMCALLSHYSTHLTSPSVPEGVAYEHYVEHMTPESMREYLEGAEQDGYAARAFAVLDEAISKLDAFNEECARILVEEVA